jgi:hypothetical protein
LAQTALVRSDTPVPGIAKTQQAMDCLLRFSLSVQFSDLDDSGQHQDDYKAERNAQQPEKKRHF